MNKMMLALCSLGALSAVGAEAPKVFAHYMTCFTQSREFTMREIALARYFGIDGFAMNCGEWKKFDAKGKMSETRYVPKADAVYAAAEADGKGFQLFFSPDFAGEMIRMLPDFNVGDMVKRYYGHPNSFRYNGKHFLSGWSGKIRDYESPVKKLRDEGFELCVVPYPQIPPHPMNWSLETVLRQFPANGVFDGLFRFAADSTAQENVASNANARRGTMFLDKIFMAGVCPAYNSPNLRDFAGVRGYMAMWEGLIRDGADLVEIVTWNDYNEDSNLMPWATHSQRGKRYFDRDASYLDITGYYSSYYKTNVRPEITQDKVFLSYRARLKGENKVWNEETKSWVDLRFGPGVKDQLHDDVRDCVYVTAFLSADAELEIIQGKNVEKRTLKRGIAHAEAPLLSGETPSVRLFRAGKEAIAFSGRRQVVAEVTEKNSAQGGHLANRTWTAGGVAGKPAFAFDLGNAALAAPDGKIELPFSGATDAPYAFALTYSNNGSVEARVTLYADGAPSELPDEPYSIPLYLPPTGGEFRTISVLWPLWAKSTRLTLRFDASDDKKYTSTDFNDFGAATFRSLTLTPVVPFRSSAPAPWMHPELVDIPGGRFSMGGPGGEGDELPAREVTISPFRMGKYEVTNAEFERFMPEHRKVRDEYSFRDREPVIYVSWVQAARYCNWLSKQNGLNAAYDEKTWKLISGANGFRLPTEAEWEYAASGRGENRRYPWGNDLPTQDRCNFAPDALKIDALQAKNMGKGTRIVGDFPAGVSRDGVYDLAGNVAEWCTDTYLDYPAGPVADPVSEGPSPHRSIRGGSWGYYNGSQRVRDREFNNQGYGGYIYIGFRVVLPVMQHK